MESIMPTLHVLLGLEVKARAPCPPPEGLEVTDCLCPVLIPVTGSTMPLGFLVVIWHPRDESACQNHCSNNILRARHLSLALLFLVGYTGLPHQHLSEWPLSLGGVTENKMNSKT